MDKKTFIPITALFFLLTILITVGPAAAAPPVANPGGPYVVDENTPVLFDGSGSSDPDAGDSIVSYDWDLNDDGIADLTGMMPTYTWCDEFSGTVNLTVKDTSGITASASTTVTVNNVAPIADAGEDQIVYEGDTVTLSGSAKDPGCDTLIYTWEFEGGTATGQDPTIAGFCDDGVYEVTLTVDDQDGGISTDTMQVTVQNVAPVVTLDAMEQPNPQFILPLVHTITLEGSYTDPGCDEWEFRWDFGDESDPVTGPSGMPGPLTESHTYGSPGDYLVVLNVTDDDGGVGEATMAIHVADVAEATHDLDNYIQNLPNTAFKGKKKVIENRKNAIDNKFDALDAKIKNEAWNGFIKKLKNDIRAKADGTIDGKKGNDWITDPEAQEHICMKIDDIIAYVKTLK